MPMKKNTNVPMNSAIVRRTASNGLSQSIPLMPPLSSPASSTTTASSTITTSSSRGVSLTAREHKGVRRTLSS